MKVCIVYPNIMKFPKFFSKIERTLPQEPALLPPMGMLYIISNSSFKMDFIDNRLHKYSDLELFEKLKSCDVVGFGGTITERPQARAVSRLLREKGIKTIYGGPNATVNWQEHINDFDIIVKGEGEITLNEVLNCIEKGENLENVQGVVFKENGEIVNNPDRPFIRDLDTLTYPAREMVDREAYACQTAPPEGWPVDYVVSSRGCPFACAFCSSKYFWKRIYRARKPKKVVEEIAYLIDQFGTKRIAFREDNFTVSRERTLEFCKLIKPLGVRWWCESRVDGVDEEMLVAMKDSGCTKIKGLGIESCSNNTLKLINKGITFEQAKRTVELCKKVGLRVSAGFIVGFPHETKEDILHTLSESRRMGVDSCFYYRFFAIPRSELYDLVIKERLDRYEYENIIIPDTRYLHADKVTNLYYHNAYNWRVRMWKRVPRKIQNLIRTLLKRSGRAEKIAQKALG